MHRFCTVELRLRSTYSMEDQWTSGSVWLSSFPQQSEPYAYSTRSCVLNRSWPEKTDTCILKVHAGAKCSAGVCTESSSAWEPTAPRPVKAWCVEISFPLEYVKGLIVSSQKALAKDLLLACWLQMTFKWINSRFRNYCSYIWSIFSEDKTAILKWIHSNEAVRIEHIHRLKVLL